ncbi:3-methyladenine DNA glycosylase [Bifidobacterium aemilianum]|uniref:Putative 3-methyladenine DNA glycosylase n=1 Tax=Bifidobacterium aemilianum TaxID=2493120 RepID=A0A366K9J3_9BIFI|nr:DNA-3-methyladenine glycosylase [Bifidobacterium aemilianum]RBP97912.1 3-methyladenine DNA glycosylase [Bifidobacterium aemilianum]
MATGDFPDFLEQSADDVARRLLGCRFIRTIGQERMVVRIVETEAYDQEDPASHTFHGESERNRAMFGPAGHAYVYFTYGMHYCLNVTAGADGFGSGVLIRAAEPMEGLAWIEARRGMTGINCTNGPAKLCRALDVDKRLYGHDLCEPPLQLVGGQLAGGESVAQTERIGISKAVHRLRRFIIAGNPYVSKPPRRR